MLALSLDLGSETFAVREAASKKLVELRASAETALREAQWTSESAEVRQRVSLLLARISSPYKLPVGGDLLRSVSSIELLERIGTERAKELLRAWREQASDPRLATEARLPLIRLP